MSQSEETGMKGHNQMPGADDAKALWQMDRDHFIHPYTDLSTFKDTGSQIITGAKGAYVTDSTGKRFLDGIGGLWCVNIGHGRQEMAEAIAAQVMEMQYYNPFGKSSNAPAARLSAKLAELAPGSLNHTFFSTGGSTANDTAMRLIHHHFNILGMPDKKKVISRIDGYHGATYVAATLTGIEGTKMDLDEVGDFIDHVSAANMYRRPDGMDEAAYCDHLVQEFEDRILEHGPENVAAFIAEPIMGAGGVMVAPKDYHRRMYEICKKYDMLYVADEVVTAFGRLGEMIASEAIFGMVPDILCLAKGISSGYIPLGATMISDEVFEVLSRPREGGSLTMGFTYSGHAVACAAALKNIEIMEREDLCGHVREVGPYFEERLAILRDLPMVGDTRGSHFMLGVELVADKETKESFDPSVDVAERVFEKCLEGGVVVRPVGGMLILSPPLVLERHECDEIVRVLGESIEAVASDLRKDGLLAS